MFSQTESAFVEALCAICDSARRNGVPESAIAMHLVRMAAKIANGTAFPSRDLFFEQAEQYMALSGDLYVESLKKLIHLRSGDSISH